MRGEFVGKKFKVMADEQFLGYYYSKNAIGAIEKAVYSNFVYHPDIIGMEDCIFSVSKGLKSDYYLWSSMPALAEEFEIPIGDVA